MRVGCQIMGYLIDLFCEKKTCVSSGYNTYNSTRNLGNPELAVFNIVFAENILKKKVKKHTELEIMS